MYKDGKMVNLIIGANAPRLMKLITDEVELYDKFKKGEIQRQFVSIYCFVIFSAWMPLLNAEQSLCSIIMLIMPRLL